MRTAARPAHRTSDCGDGQRAEHAGKLLCGTSVRRCGGGGGALRRAADIRRRSGDALASGGGRLAYEECRRSLPLRNRGQTRHDRGRPRADLASDCGRSRAGGGSRRDRRAVSCWLGADMGGSRHTPFDRHRLRHNLSFRRRVPEPAVERYAGGAARRRRADRPPACGSPGQ